MQFPVRALHKPSHAHGKSRNGTGMGTGIHRVPCLYEPSQPGPLMGIRFLVVVTRLLEVAQRDVRVGAARVRKRVGGIDR